MAEVRERQGGTPAEWDDEPWEFVLYCYLHLKDMDRRRAWVVRMERLEAAELMALAFHEPRRLSDERSRLIASAAARSEISEAEMQGWLAQARDIQRSKLVQVC